MAAPLTLIGIRESGILESLSTMGLPPISPWTSGRWHRKYPQLTNTYTFCCIARSAPHPIHHKPVQPTANERYSCNTDPTWFNIKDIEPHPGPALHGAEPIFHKASNIRANGEIDAHACTPPKVWDDSEGDTISSTNYTCLETHLQHLLDSPAHVTLIQETFAPPHKLADLKAKCKAIGKHLVAGPLDPNTKHNLGGVAACATHGRGLIEVTPLTDTFRAAIANGRAAHYAVNTSSHMEINYYVICGWSGSNKNKAKQARTNRLIQACRDEMAEQPDGPSRIVGDLNADPENIASLRHLLEHEDWVDVGANAHVWGRKDNEYTCITQGSKQGTRRDYLFCNTHLFPYICNFLVDHDPDIPTHATLWFQVTSTPQPNNLFHLRKPASLRTQLETHFFEDAEGELADADKHELWCKHLPRFHANLEELMSAAAEELQELLDVGDTTGFFQAWSRTFEKAV